MNENPPDSLDTHGSALWQKIVEAYDLRPDELATLQSACVASDMVARVEAAWVEDGRPMYSKGSMGQLVEHPAPKGVRSWQAAKDAALARLKLPDLDAGAEANQNRDAANASWQPGVRGRGA